MTKTQKTELHEELINRSFKKIKKSSWVLNKNGQVIKIDLITGAIQCDWKYDRAQDRTYFDHSSNTFDISNAIDSAILWADRYLLGI